MFVVSGRQTPVDTFINMGIIKNDKKKNNGIRVAMGF
jgi:hypothetical protein